MSLIRRVEAQRGVPLLGGIVGDVTGCGKDMEVRAGRINL
jgi:hypothetical protein